MKTPLPEERAISIKDGLPVIPERLLLAHAKGQVLFVVGAGASKPAGLPDFKTLTKDVFEQYDLTIHKEISGKPIDDEQPLPIITNSQQAEINRFNSNEFDVALGMLERRMSINNEPSQIRETVFKLIRSKGPKPAKLHKALMKLSDRGAATSIVTTNYDLLLQAAAKKNKVATYSIGEIPRPSRNESFAGVFHIHGCLNKDPSKFSEIILTDEDFGEFYMRRRTIPDFIYDASRLFHLVFVGYRADDPPMKYLLNAIAADGKRFEDHKERFSFVGLDDKNPALSEEWRKRGITPITYDTTDNHVELLQLLENWAALSVHNGKEKVVESKLKRIVRKKRSEASESDVDLIDHLVRRASSDERIRLARIIAKNSTSMDWADAIVSIMNEPRVER